MHNSLSLSIRKSSAYVIYLFSQNELNSKPIHMLPIALLLAFITSGYEWTEIKKDYISSDTEVAKAASAYALKGLVELDEKYDGIDVTVDDKKEFYKTSANGEDFEIHFAIAAEDITRGLPKQVIDCVVFFKSDIENEQQFQGVAFSDFPVIPTKLEWECNSYGCA